jgi:hypothetical protein
VKLKVRLGSDTNLKLPRGGDKQNLKFTHFKCN